MAEARGRAEWSRTAELLAMVANLVRDPKKRKKPFKGLDFNPHAGRHRAAKDVKPMADVSLLKTIFVDSRGA